jgi:hypothetical protein
MIDSCLLFVVCGVANWVGCCSEGVDIDGKKGRKNLRKGGRGLSYMQKLHANELRLGMLIVVTNTENFDHIVL